MRPAYTTWKPGDNGGITKIDETTGELMCLVEVPAEYKTVTKKVLRTAATTKSIDIPAAYADVEKRVMKAPGRTVVTEIPAQYEMREVTKLMEPAREMRVPVAAVYEDVSTKVLVADGSYEWRSVLCKTNATEAKITEIQQALKSRGHYDGEVNGILTSETLDAVQSFEKANGLPADRFINIETVNALGVSPT
ncbi:MAG: peptidoglycan-binding domain-containing protein [Burkholderiales bacterium]